VNGWPEILATGTAYLALAVLGALVLAGLWWFTASLRGPWLPLQRVRPMSWKGVDVLLVFLTMEAVPILVDQTLREAGVFHWLYGVPADPSTRGREQLWSLALALPLTMALIVFSLKLLRGTRLTELGVTPVRAGNNATVGYAQWLILTPLTLAIYLLALLVTPEEWRGEHSITQVAQQPLAVSEWVLFFAAAVVLAPMLEELVFRGYFQRQFESFTHSRWLALFLQAALFGIGHGYQGIEACVKIACFGGLFGLLALWRKSLRPGMMAHAWTDILGGIFGI